MFYANSSRVHIPHSGSLISLINTAAVAGKVVTLPADVVMETLNVSFVGASQILSFSTLRL